MRHRAGGSGISAWWQDTRGDFDDLLYAMMGILLMLMLFLFIITVITVFAVRQHVYNSIVSAAQVALASNAIDPILATSGQSQDAELVYVSPLAVTDTFNAEFAQFLGWPPQSYSLSNATVTVYEPDNAGQAMPSGLQGTIPGTGIYVNFPYTVQLLPFMHSHTLQFGFAVQAFIPASRYNAPESRWLGG